MSKIRRNRISCLPFLTILWGIYEKNVCSQIWASEVREFWASLKTRSAKPPKVEPPPLFAATETNVADDAIKVEDDNTAHGSSKESSNKRDHEKETPVQNKLRTELGEINDELASHACIRERTGLSDEYKKRVKALTSKKNEVEKKLNRKMQDVQSQQRLREKKKKALDKLTQDHPDVSNVLIYHKSSSCHGLLALFV